MTPETEKLAGLLGARLKAFRKEMKIKQSVFAGMIGISDDTLSLIEQGRKLPRLETLCAIAERLGKTVRELLDFDEKPKSDSATSKQLNSLNLYLKANSASAKEIKMVRDVARCFLSNARGIYLHTKKFGVGVYEKPRRSSKRPYPPRARLRLRASGTSGVYPVV